jgi:hypothetical protein
MTVSLHIKVEGLDALKRKLGADWHKPIQDGAVAVGQELRNVVAQYPGPSSQPVEWASEKQRRWWFASRRKANLPFKYTRNSDAWSQRLGPSWTVRPEGQTNAVVGTKATYGPWVQSHAQQTAQHKATGWKTDKEAVEEVERGGKAMRIFRAIIQKWLKR